MNFFITRVSRSLFNFISTIIISKSVVWLALKVALFKYFLYLQDVSCVFVNLSWWWSRSVESPATGLRVLAGVLRFCSIQSIAMNLSEFKIFILKLASQCLKHLQGVHQKCLLNFACLFLSHFFTNLGHLMQPESLPIPIMVLSLWIYHIQDISLQNLNSVFCWTPCSLNWIQFRKYHPIREQQNYNLWSLIVIVKIRLVAINSSWAHHSM